MTAKPYTILAPLYSHVMKYIDYSGWANYILEVHKSLGLKNTAILELASGNCKIASYLSRKIKNIIVTDISFQMLGECSDSPVQKVCCDMVHLPFKSKFNFIFSTFDSLNYLDEEAKIELFFKNIYFYLEDEGYFTFDVSLEENSLKHEKELNRKGKYKGRKYSQKSEYYREERIHYNTFVIENKDGSVRKEIHRQKIYDFNYYFKLADKYGFKVVNCYDSFTFSDAHLRSERVQFVIKKI